MARLWPCRSSDGQGGEPKTGCESCHGNVTDQNVLWQEPTLHMEWCLDCHRNPIDNLRPVDQVTNLAYDQRTELTYEERVALKDLYHINPSENCSTCHR